MFELPPPLDMRTLSDDELRRRYLAADSNDDGEVFIAIYVRYRDSIRSTMERLGLPQAMAERRVGSVFIRGMERIRAADAEADSLRDCLLAEARAAADDPDWTEV